MTSDYSKLQAQFRREIKPCDLCGCADYDVLQKRGRVGKAGVYGDLQITICHQCGLKMQNPRFENAFYEAYYEKMYREVAFGAEKPSPLYIQQQKHRGAKVLQWVEKIVSTGVMLDHGCASGATMLAWQDAGWKTSGIDPHKPSVLTGTEMGLDITFATGERLPFKDDTFDLVLSLGSLEHAYDLTHSMEELRRVTREHGWLLIRWRSDIIFGSPMEYYNHNHYRFFSKSTWNLCLEKFGYSVIEETDEPLEGWDSYAYILSRAERSPDVIKTRGDNYLEVLKDTHTLRETYYHRCKTYQDFYARWHHEPTTLIRKVREAKAEFQWGFLGGDPHDVIERALMEAKRYITEYEAGRAI